MCVFKCVLYDLFFNLPPSPMYLYSHYISHCYLTLSSISYTLYSISLFSHIIPSHTLLHTLPCTLINTVSLVSRSSNSRVPGAQWCLMTTSNGSRQPSGMPTSSASSTTSHPCQRKCGTLVLCGRLMLHIHIHTYVYKTGITINSILSAKLTIHFFFELFERSSLLSHSLVISFLLLSYSLHFLSFHSPSPIYTYQIFGDGVR